MGKTTIKTEIVLSGDPAIKKRLEILDCDFDAFWDDLVLADKNAKPHNEAYESFLGNMMLSINYHLWVMKGRVKTFEHPGGHGNVPVVYKCSPDDFGSFVERAWNRVAARILEKDPYGKLTHLEAL